MIDIPFTFERAGFSFTDLSWEDLPFNDGVMYSPRGGLVEYDDEGISVKKVRGKYYDQPVRQCVMIKSRLDVYHRTQDETYLDVAIDHAEHLMANAVFSRNAAYLPYPFPWNLHGFVEAPMPVPWYAGMAQGHALSAFCRLYTKTGLKRYLDFAHQVFKTFLNLPSGSDPWIVHLLDERFVWFEEGPRNNGPSDLTFNGHIFGVYGLYDYWKVTGDERAELLADGGMTSVLAYMDRWRLPGGMSFYCMTHREQYHNYHATHADQLGVMYNLTKHPIWATLQDRFMEDYPIFARPRLETDTLVIKPGTYVVGGHGDMTVTERLEVTIESEERYECNLRGRLVGETGIYCRIRDKEIGTRQFPEIPGQVYLLGIREHMTWVHPREMRVTSSSPLTVRFDDDGAIRDKHRLDPIVTPSIQVIERALILGETWMKIGQGEHAGEWIQASSIEPIVKD